MYWASTFWSGAHASVAGTRYALSRTIGTITELGKMVSLPEKDVHPTPSEPAAIIDIRALRKGAEPLQE